METTPVDGTAARDEAAIVAVPVAGEYSARQDRRYPYVPELGVACGEQGCSAAQ